MTHDIENIPRSIRRYHTKHSRDHSGSVVKNPGHIMIYYLPNEDQVAISRILHESRDVQRHIPEQHKEQARQSKYQRPKISRPTGRGNDKDKSLQILKIPYCSISDGNLFSVSMR